MNNSQMIMNNDLFSAFEHQLAHLGLIDTPSSSETIVLSDPLADGIFSITEERAWMLHQQNPLAASGPFVLAFKLIGALELDRLVLAIKKLYSSDSNLNLVYSLDTQGQLGKSHQNMDNMRVPIHLVDSDRAAINYLLEIMQIPMDLSREPALKFYLMPKNNQEVVLGILGHHILLDDRAWKPIFSHLSNFYNHPNTDIAAVKMLDISRQTKRATTEYWQQKFEQGLHRINWPKFILRPDAALQSINEYGKTAVVDTGPHVARVFTSVELDPLLELSRRAESSLFHTMAALFGFYINSILNLEAIDVFIPVIDHSEISSLNQLRSSSNILPLRIEKLGKDIVEQIVQLRNQMLQGIEHNLPIEQILSATKTQRHAIPNVLITQFTDSTPYISLNKVEVVPLDLPPIDSEYDLTLAFQIRKADRLHLELTTGKQLSAYAASLLLEQFTAFLAQDFSQQLQLLPLLATASDTMQAQDLTAASAQSQTTIDANLSIAELLLQEFRTVLLNDTLTLHDHFFDCGGHSILATRVIGRLQSQHQIIINIADFFKAPTAYELSKYAQYLEQSVTTHTIFDPNDTIIAPISLLQKAFMGFSEQGRDPMYNIPYAFRFSEAVDEQLFFHAFVDILERHHALRSIFIFHEVGEISQSVVPLNQLSNHPWFWYSDTQQQHAAQEILAQEAHHCFELTKEFPIRVRFLKDEQGNHILSLLLYHIAMDEWSSGILIQELFAAYCSRVGGEQPKWSNIPRQFHEYALQQEEDVLHQHLDFWKNSLGQLHKAPPLFKGGEQQQDAHPTVAGAAVDFTLNAQATDQLYQLANLYKSSMFYVVYAAIVLSTHLLGAGKKVLTATSVACRDNPEFQDTIGYFTNVIMHYTEFKEELLIADLVQQVQQNIQETALYADVPFAIVEEAVRAEDEQSTESPYEIYIQLHAKNALTGAFQLKDGHQIGFELLEPERDIAKFGLHFEVYEEPLSEQNRLRVVVNYRVNRYSTEQINLIKSTTQHVLQRLINLAKQSEQSAETMNVMQMRKHLMHMNIHSTTSL